MSEKKRKIVSEVIAAGILCGILLFLQFSGNSSNLKMSMQAFCWFNFLSGILIGLIFNMFAHNMVDLRYHFVSLVVLFCIYNFFIVLSFPYYLNVKMFLAVQVCCILYLCFVSFQKKLLYSEHIETKWKIIYWLLALCIVCVDYKGLLFIVPLYLLYKFMVDNNSVAGVIFIVLWLLLYCSFYTNILNYAA